MEKGYLKKEGSKTVLGRRKEYYSLTERKATTTHQDSYNPSVEDIVGKWAGVKIHLVGFILLLAKTTTGRIMLVSTLVILLLTELIRIIRKNKDYTSKQYPPFAG